MNRINLKPATALILTFGFFVSSAQAIQKQVSLTAYSDPDSYASSAFNFEKMSQDPFATGNRFHILYQPSNEVSTQTVVGDLGSIVDLGQTSCQNLPAEHEAQGNYPGQGHGGYPYKEDRILNPMFWLTYSSAWNILQVSRQSSITPLIGHCYLLHLIGQDGITVAMFHVKDLVPGRMLLIDEIELFQRAGFLRNN
jgi:hypothetical protein